MTARSAGPVVVNMGSRFADGLVAALEHMVPHERFVGCAPGEPLPHNAEVLVTLLDDPAGIEALLLPQIRWVHMLSTGVDGFPFGAAGERILTCSRGASGTAIAEWVLAVMLAFEKRLPESWITEPPERWNVASLGTLAQRNLSIIGLGTIGTEVARRALAFDMSVTALRRTPRPSPIMGVTIASSLDELVTAADHLVVAAPATPETTHLLNASVFVICKPGVHVVNVARGALIDQDALIQALDKGVVARASLDVVDPEPLPAGHPLYTHPGVRLSPHISWSAGSSATKTFDLFVDNLRLYREGDPLHGRVDAAAGY